MHYLAARAMIMKTEELFNLWQEYKETIKSDRSRISIIFLTKIEPSPFYMEKYVEQLKEFTPPDHNSISLEVQKIIDQYGYSALRDALVLCIERHYKQNGMYDSKLYDALEKLPKRIKW